MAVRKSISQSKKTGKPKALSSDISQLTQGQSALVGTKGSQLEFSAVMGSDGHLTRGDRSCL